jgi:hypothetical protein
MNINAKILNKMMANGIQQQNDHSPQPSGLHPRDAVVVQHIQIYKCNAAH